jgi:tetratricopeptide (TPR) repeat protein
MYLLIPLIVFLSSLLLIAWIVVRKFVYLKKLVPETLENSAVVQESFWAELFPELAASLKKIKLREWGIAVLAEFEKFLRKLRLISMKIDTFTNQLIHNVRKTTVYHEEVLSKKAETKEEQTTGEARKARKKEKDWKEEEQRLIIEIAKDPKNAGLYKKLGRLYLGTGENEDAYESFKKAAELNPEDAEAKAKLEKLIPKIKNGK